MLDGLILFGIPAEDTMGWILFIKVPKFPPDAGFVYDKVPATAVLLKEKIKDTSCIFDMIISYSLNYYKQIEVF
jgi:hypothetical protein